MKKALIGTTALVAAGLMSGTASAADPIKLGLSGNFRAILGYANQDDGAGQVGANRRNFGIGHDSKINFTGKTTLDNGIEVGVAIELEPEADARGNTLSTATVQGVSGNQATIGEVDIIDEAYIYLENQNVWGRVELGDRDGASNKMNTTGPFVLGTSIVGVATMQAVSAPAGNQAGNPIFSPGARGTLAADGTKITYYTPRFAGIQLGASYTPDRVENQGRFGIGVAAVDSSTLAADAAQGDIKDVSVNYVMRFGELGVRANVGYTKGNQESNAVGTFDEREFVIGGQLDYKNWSFGGGLIKGDANVNAGGAANRKKDDDLYRLGLTYSMGPWLAGVEYANRQVDQIAGGKDEVSIWGIAARRLLGPGVTIGAGLRYWDWQDSTNAPAAENQATELLVETSFSF